MSAHHEGGTTTDPTAEVDDLRHEVEGLRSALETRTHIGYAVGIVCERYGLTTQQAWSLLARLSSQTNVAVRDLSRVLVAQADGSVSTEDDAVLEQLLPHLPGVRVGRGRHE